MISVVLRIAIITVSVAICVIIFELLMMWLRRSVEQKGNKQYMRRLINLFRLVFYGLVAIVELGVWGINLVALLAGAGFLGIIIGLAVQQPLGNFFAGAYIVISRLVRIGDKISINAIGSNINVTGTINHIGFTHSELIDGKGKLNYVPNTLMISSILVMEKRWQRK